MKIECVSCKDEREAEKQSPYLFYTNAIARVLFDLYSKPTGKRFADLKRDSLLYSILEILYFCRSKNSFEDRFPLDQFLNSKRHSDGDEKQTYAEVWYLLKAIFTNRDSKIINILRGRVFELFVRYLVYAKYEKFLADKTIRVRGCPHSSVSIDGKCITKKKNVDYVYLKENANKDFISGEFGECKIKGTSDEEIPKLQILESIVAALASNAQPSTGIWVTLSQTNSLERKLRPEAPSVIFIGVNNFNRIEENFLFC